MKAPGQLARAGWGPFPLRAEWAGRTWREYALPGIGRSYGVTMRRAGLPLILGAAVIVLTGCTGAGEGHDPSSAPVERGRFGVVDPASPEHAAGPVLCLEGMTEATPPTCAGPAISGWDWGRAPEHDEWSGGGETVRWGYHAFEYRVIDDGEVSVDMDSVTID